MIRLATGQGEACGILLSMADAAMSREDILRWALLTAYSEHWPVLLDAPLSTKPHDYIPIIYSKSFAQAFWGKDWEQHRWQLLRHRNKLAYLARFL